MTRFRNMLRIENMWTGIADGISGSLRLKLTLVFVAVALVPMIAIAVISIRRASDTITRQALSTTLAENEASVAELEIFLAQFPTDILTFANSPPVQGMIRARESGGIDPVSGDPFDIWSARLSEIFVAAETHKRFYDQLRYLDESGNEIVRVDFVDGEPAVITGTDQLQSKSDRPYFVDSGDLEKGTVLISEMNLNRERGELEVPHVPVLRFSTPVFNISGDFKGVIVSNVTANALFELIEQSITRNGYLATEDLSLAVHPEPSMLWGSDLGSDVNLDTEFAKEHRLLRANLDNGSGDSVVSKNSERGEIVALGALFFDPSNPERHWVVGSTTTTSAVLAGVVELGNLILGAAVVVGILAAILAVYLASGLTRRVGAVGSALSQISQGGLGTQVAFKSSDEIGQLADSYRAMVDYLGALTAAASRIAGGDLTVDVTPASDEDALGNAFSVMVPALREAVQLREAALESENRELVRINAMRNEFLSSVSHELRTPLTSLLAFGDILARDKDGTLTGRQIEHLDLLRNNGWKLEALIDDLLDVAQSEAGTFTIEKSLIDVAGLLRQIVASTRSVFENKSQQLEVQIEAESVWVMGDERRVTQVFNNLLTNASKYSLEDTTTVLRLTETPEGVEIDVIDQGIGIDSIDVARLFTPFFRVNSEHSRRVGGTGLGLVVAKTIVQLHGGSIRINSKPGVGTTMRVTLPASKTADMVAQLVGSEVTQE